MGTILQIWRCITLKEVLLLMQGLKRFMGGMMKGKSGCDGMIALTASKVLVGDEIPANGFKTYFVARFSNQLRIMGFPTMALFSTVYKAVRARSYRVMLALQRELQLWTSG
jgi:hypothetical protein